MSEIVDYTNTLNRRCSYKSPVCAWIRDGSVIYGNNEKGMKRARTFKDGKLKISEDGLLEHDEKGIPISGDVRNCWAGFSLLQALFVKEHNALCDMLKVRQLPTISCIPFLHLLDCINLASKDNAWDFSLLVGALS